MTTEYERSVLDRYSTPGLRKNAMTLSAKRDHLRSLGVKEDDAEKIIAEIFPLCGEIEFRPTTITSNNDSNDKN